MVGNIIINTVDKLEGKAVLCNSKGKSGYNEKKNMTFLMKTLKTLINILETF